ncbi:hypothetical protein [Tropicimonas sp. IMCC34011]|uniref:hypothetical protein n=1 Tax=Tropicimonas sp. IMCC34011 TaxID=2248759 RepID=UPI001300AEEE|nr:hypothetical protein [Tropicimonas sp. IMCC34011]
MSIRHIVRVEFDDDGEIEMTGMDDDGSVEVTFAANGQMREFDRRDDARRGPTGDALNHGLAGGDVRRIAADAGYADVDWIEIRPNHVEFDATNPDGESVGVRLNRDGQVVREKRRRLATARKAAHARIGGGRGSLLFLSRPGTNRDGSSDYASLSASSFRTISSKTGKLFANKKLERNVSRGAKRRDVWHSSPVMRQISGSELSTVRSAAVPSKNTQRKVKRGPTRVTPFRIQASATLGSSAKTHSTGSPVNSAITSRRLKAIPSFAVHIRLLTRLRPNHSIG